MNARIGLRAARSPASRPRGSRNVLGCLVLLAALAALAASSAPAATGGSRRERAAAEWSHDGQRRTRVPGLDLVYVREGASLAGYREVWLKSVEVAFRRDWQVPTRPGSRVPPRDVARIKDGLAGILREETARELARGGYALAAGPGEGVLEVDVSIVDLYVNAPDVQGAATVERYTFSTGEMTLVAELRDSPTGDLVARVLDHREDRDRGFLDFTTSADNLAAARVTVREWAGILRRHLDAAQGIGTRR
jgi:hypothetical protein